MTGGNGERRSSTRLDYIRKVADYIVETYRPQEGPKVLMWREIMVGYRLKVAPDLPNEWTRDSRAVSSHWQDNGPDVQRRLEDRYKVTIVRVSRRIRDLAKHGEEPKLGGGRGINERSAANYRSCLPHSQAPTYGFVCFPQGQGEDHPLLIAEMERRGQSSSSYFRNTARRLDRAEGFGVLSTEEGLKIKKKMGEIALEAIKDDHPLFAPRAIEATEGSKTT